MFQGVEKEKAIVQLQNLSQWCEEKAAESEEAARKYFYEGMAIAYSTIEQKFKGNDDYLQPDFLEQLFDSIKSTQSVRHSDPEICSFCQKSSSEVGVMAAGPGVCICAGCLEFGKEVIQSQEQQEPHSPFSTSIPYRQTCSFCQKSSSEVGALALGPGVSICAGCLEFGKDVI